MKLILHERELRLEYPFATAHGRKTSAKALIVELRDGDVSGYGEAPENQYFTATVDAARQALEAERSRIEASSSNDPAGLYESMREALGPAGFALSALDCAAWDLYGKRCGEPVWRLFGFEAPFPGGPMSSYTIGLDTLEVMAQKLRAHADWPIYKIKLAADEAVSTIAALREVTDKPFRVDANCAWDPDSAIDIAHRLAAFNVELIEQPLPPEDDMAMREVLKHSSLPMIADESCVIESHVDRCHGLFDGVNVKLTKCGGLTPALRMLRRGRELGMRTMIGCMTETTVGISAAAQLLPLLDYVDLDGANLLAEDVAEGARVERGAVVVTEAPGCGLRLT
jgi:L-alanine-DL-glutamate epimerase-like enolase superfamily enzyme